jgi:hypothetical protein
MYTTRHVIFSPILAGYAAIDGLAVADSGKSQFSIGCCEKDNQNLLNKIWNLWRN